MNVYLQNLYEQGDRQAYKAAKRMTKIMVDRKTVGRAKAFTEALRFILIGGARYNEGHVLTWGKLQGVLKKYKYKYDTALDQLKGRKMRAKKC